MMSELRERLKQAEGGDTKLEHDIHMYFFPDDEESLEVGWGYAPKYLTSVDACLALMGEVLPSWDWERRVSPRPMETPCIRLVYCAVHLDEEEAPKPTEFIENDSLPIALLIAILKAKDQPHE